MNLTQYFEQLKLDNPQRYFSSISTSQLNNMAIGIGIVVALFIIYKFWSWSRRRRELLATSFRKREQKPSTNVADFIKPNVPAHVDSQPTPSNAVEIAAETSQVPVAMAQSVVPLASEESRAEPIASVSGWTPNPHPHERKYSSSGYWPTEPKVIEKSNPFEEGKEEYPWADGSDYAFGSATPLLSDLLPTSESGRKDLTKTLRNAGYYSPHAWQNLSAVRYIGIILPILLFGTLLVVVPESLEPYMIAGIVIGPILGWALPTLYVRSKAATRLREIETAMPDMLDLLNMCVSQGMTVPTSLRRVGKEITPVYPALSKELMIVAEQARVGHLSEGLTSLAERVDTPEVHSFSSLMIQTEEMGTSVSEALNDYSDSMRESQKQRADEKANAATFKLLFPTVLCLMPAVFLFLMGPALIDLNAFFTRGGIQGLDQGANAALQQQRTEQAP
ncbi:type II secretion system F family protein [Planctomicrobium sp. SH668]|uniref:type II secretion system F family protein n=1 Tax=Planctomicrobium sp. SH668 TaxID=3448126 RepID=UPI003F5BB940